MVGPIRRRLADDSERLDPEILEDLMSVQLFGMSTEEILRRAPLKRVEDDLPREGVQSPPDPDEVSAESPVVGTLNRRRDRRESRRERRKERRKSRRPDPQEDFNGAVVIPIGKPKTPRAVMELGHTFYSTSFLSKKTLNYKHNWKQTPHCIHSIFGKWKITIPWGIEWKKACIDIPHVGKLCLPFSVPWFGTKDIYLPVPIFVNDSDRDKIEVWILLGECHFFYNAIGDFHADTRFGTIPTPSPRVRTEQKRRGI